jgi:hypothetical protein
VVIFCANVGLSSFVELAVTPAAPTRRWPRRRCSRPPAAAAVSSSTRSRFAWWGRLGRQRQHRRRVGTLRVGFSSLRHRRVFVSPPSIRLLLLRLRRHGNLARVSCSPASCRLQSCPEGAIEAWFVRSWEHRSFQARSWAIPVCLWFGLWEIESCRSWGSWGRI